MKRHFNGNLVKADCIQKPQINNKQMKTNVLKLKADSRDDPLHVEFLSLLTKGPNYCTLAPRLFSSIKNIFSPFPLPLVSKGLLDQKIETDGSQEAFSRSYRPWIKRPGLECRFYRCSLPIPPHTVTYTKMKMFLSNL